MMVERLHAQFLAGFLFRCDIRRRIGPVADQHRRQPRFGFASGSSLRHFGGDLLADFLGNQFSINKLSCHGFSSIRL